jgi:rubrerythrin
MSDDKRADAERKATEAIFAPFRQLLEPVRAMLDGAPQSEGDAAADWSCPSCGALHIEAHAGLVCPCGDVRS